RVKIARKLPDPEANSVPRQSGPARAARIDGKLTRARAMTYLTTPCVGAPTEHSRYRHGGAEDFSEELGRGFGVGEMPLFWRRPDAAGAAPAPPLHRGGACPRATPASRRGGSNGPAATP